MIWLSKGRRHQANENRVLLEDRKLSAACFVWLGSNRWVKFRYLFLLPRCSLVFLARADKTFISWAFFCNHGTTPRGRNPPQARRCPRGSKDTVDKGERFISIVHTWSLPHCCSCPFFFFLFLVCVIFQSHARTQKQKRGGKDSVMSLVKG